MATFRHRAPQGRHRILAKTVIIATGAYEVPLIVPGWTLPGVMTIGAGQTLVRRYGVAPGARTVIAGNGPLDAISANSHSIVAR